MLTNPDWASYGGEGFGGLLHHGVKRICTADVAETGIA